MTHQRETIPTELKDELLVEAMHRCCLCPQHEDITEIHHVVPIRERGPNAKENLMVVCPTCHAKIHRIRTMYTPKQLKMYKARWVNLCAKGLPLEERMIKAPGLSLSLKPSLHNQTPPEPNFVGQVDKLKTLTDWYNDPKVRIGALIGWGGVGKSALVRKWYDSLEENNIHPDGIFWWGFYRNASLDLFLNALLRYVSRGQIEPESITSTWEKVERIMEYLHQGSYLLVLDGLEQMQKSESGDEFGQMIHRECTELLHYLADVAQAGGSGLCLITTRYPLRDLNPWREHSYKEQPVMDLNIPDSLKMLRERGVKGSEEDITEVITRFKGHALSLTSLAGYLTRYYAGDIRHAPDIAFVLSDKERFKDVNKLLRKYAEKMFEAERVFLQLFSLFRTEVTETDFAIGFRHRLQDTEFNKALVKMSELDFKDLVNGLVDWRLISYDETKETYTTHPLIKSYFDSTFDEQIKKLCHKHLYQYFGLYAPEQPETLEEMQPLFEQVYHGCAAGLYDEVLDQIFIKELDRGIAYIAHNLGAWNTSLSIIQSFFPLGDFRREPRVSKKGYQGYLLNNAGLALLSTGRPKEAEESFLTAIKMDIKDTGGNFASSGYRNLADLQVRTGELRRALSSAKKALEFSEKSKVDEFIPYSDVYHAWILHLLGKDEEAEKEFKEADELLEKICGYRLHGIWGVFYVDSLILLNRIDEACELTKQNLAICQSSNSINDISRYHRCLGALERIKGSHEEAENHLHKALEIARTVGMPELEIEALIEFGRLYLDMERHEEAVQSGDLVLKLCERTGFKFYEPDAEVVLGKAYLASGDTEQAETFAQSAYEKAVSMKYRWPEGDAAHLLGEIYVATGEKAKARAWLEKAIACRKEIFDPEVNESEELLKGL